MGVGDNRAVHVIPITGENAGPMTGRGTNTYLIPGAQPTLIDAAEDSATYVDRIAAALEQAQPGATLSRVLVTHAHSDHVGGVRALARRWPLASFAKIADTARDDASIGWERLQDDQVVPVGDGALWVVATPGHAPDHAAFFEMRSSILFSGDLVVNGGTVTVPPSSGGHLGSYLDSLRRVLSLQPRRLFPGHGPPVDSPGALLRAYIVHRLGRERQILEVLASGPAEPAEVARQIYPANLAEELRPAARENVLAHLIKLQEDGRAVQDGDRWRVV